MEDSEAIRSALNGRARRHRAAPEPATPLDLAIAWVRAGGGQGKEREALLAAIDPFDQHAFTLPSGIIKHDMGRALKLWKLKAARTIAAEGRGRGPNGGVKEERVPRLVTVTPGIAYRLDRGETVTITGATLVEADHG